MKPRPPDDPAESLLRLREQLILAQVRIMELEDAGAEGAARLAEIEGLLRGAQTLADQKADVLTHLEGVHADLEAQSQHLRHLQHVTNEALNDTRSRLAAAEERCQQADVRIGALDAQRRELEQLRADLASRVSRLDEARVQAEERSRGLERELGDSRATAVARAQRIDQLDAELRAMKASRSWRWTRALRAIERWRARHRSS
jgi:chromosome segregation ATPase